MRHSYNEAETGWPCLPPAPSQVQHKLPEGYFVCCHSDHPAPRMACGFSLDSVTSRHSHGRTVSLGFPAVCVLRSLGPCARDTRGLASVCLATGLRCAIWHTLSTCGFCPQLFSGIFPVPTENLLLQVYLIPHNRPGCIVQFRSYLSVDMGVYPLCRSKVSVCSATPRPR